MGSILLGLLLNPNGLLAYAGLALLAVVIYFTLGPARLLKIALDIRTWFALALALAVLAFAHSERLANDLEAQIAAAAAQGQADRDAVIETRRRQQEDRHQQAQRIDDAIQAAPPGEAQDAALDAIAAERPHYHGLQDEEDPARARADPGADADGLRKHPDGVVVP